MKIKILRSRFLEGLKVVQNIVGGKGSLNILQNVLLEANEGKLVMTTTDLDISVKTNCECEVIENGGTTLPVKLLFNAISKLIEGEITIEVDSNDRAVIYSGNAKFKIGGLPEKDFPRHAAGDNSLEYKIEKNDFKEMLRKVFYAASQDDTRRTLKGVLVSFKNQSLTMVATDGRRLALIKNEVEFNKENEKDIVLPAKAVVELQRILNGEGELVIKASNNQICLVFDNTQIYSKLIEDTYPNYTQVIPKETLEKISIERLPLLDALERVSVMTIDEAHSIRLTFSAGKLTVASAASAVGEAKDEVDIKYGGEKIEIMFNPSYIMDCLKNIDEDEISINLNDGHSPAVMKNENPSKPFLYVLMPLRIS